MAVRRAMDRVFRKGRKKKFREGRALGGGSGAGRTVTLTPRCTEKKKSGFLKKVNEMKAVKK